LEPPLAIPQGARHLLELLFLQLAELLPELALAELGSGEM
jgi:hypothetical protein